MADQALSKFLKNAAQNWGKTVEEAGKGFGQFEDGDYIGQLSKAVIAQSKKGVTQIRWGYTILEGDYKGEHCTEFMGLENELGLKPLAWRLQQFEIELADVNLEKLQDLLDWIVKQQFKCKFGLRTTKSSAGEFQNFKWQTLLSEYVAEPEIEVADSSPGDIEPEPLPDDPATDMSPESTVDECHVGSKVRFFVDGKQSVGIVKSMDEEAGTAVVKVGVASKTMPFEELELVDDGLDVPAAE